MYSSINYWLAVSLRDLWHLKRATGRLAYTTNEDWEWLYSHTASSIFNIHTGYIFKPRIKVIYLFFRMHLKLKNSNQLKLKFWNESTKFKLCFSCNCLWISDLRSADLNSDINMWNNFFSLSLHLRCCPWSRCCGMGDFRPRTVWLGHPEKRDQRYPRNVINNQKYNFFTFLPAVSVSQRSLLHPSTLYPANHHLSPSLAEVQEGCL